jgi:hypothetical protein
MAGSVDIISNDRTDRVRTIILKWTSDASGNVSDVGGVSLPGGTLYAFSQLPGAGVTNEFDLTVPCEIILADGNTITFADALGGEGADLSNSTDGAAVMLSTQFAIPYNAMLELSISNAGNAKSGYIILFVWEEV